MLVIFLRQLKRPPEEKSPWDFLRPTASHKDKLNRNNRKGGRALFFLFYILKEL